MKISRRNFLKLSGLAALTGSLAAKLGCQPDDEEIADPSPDTEQPKTDDAVELRIQYADTVTTICPFCGVGCGILCFVEDGKLIGTEGDGDNPLNEGTLCSKGSALFNMAYEYDEVKGEPDINSSRITKVLYRAPKASDWEEKDWDWALETIADRIKNTRDEYFEQTNSNGVTVNRCKALAWLGSAMVNNEENYLFHKIARALGIINFDHCARLCHSSTVAGLGNTFGRGAMTNHINDFQHSDVVMNIGGNTAEMHPISMKWIQRARDTKGAKLIVADPRVSRTAAVADLYAPLRPGTNVAFLSGLIQYALENEKYHREYVVNYTNASYLVNPDFKFEDGLFSGAGKHSEGHVLYDKSTWAYQRNGDGSILKDETLEDPNCVFQLMKEHYSRYDIKTVSEITGCPQDKFRETAELFCSTGEPGKAGSISYSMGQTQFTCGAANVRSTAILQLLLGNLGIAGGGVNAQRGQSNVQGACDMGNLYHIIPGYLGMIRDNLHPTFNDYNEKETPATGYWSNKPKFLVSLLKAFWGENATAENDFCYDYFPKLDQKDRSHIGIFNYMGAGEIKGFINWADNPAVSGPNCSKERSSMANLDWLVCVDLFECETAAFWKAPGTDPANIDTEVFLLPAALHIERDGTIANTGRWIQWRNKAVEAPGDCKPDLWIVDRLFKAVKKAYEADPGPFPNPILEMHWGYGEDADSAEVAKEINGYETATGNLLNNFTALADDGSTTCGSWIYSGYYNDESNPPCKKRIRETEGIGNHSDWSFSWPVNRRILYNRCSCDADGKPWNPDVPVMWYDNGEWTGNDIPDFNATVSPEENVNTPFIMRPELQALLFGPGMADGPFPEYYEPWESPYDNIMSSVQFNPCSQVWYPQERAEVGSTEFPYVATSYRLTEHYQSGTMTRNIPWLNELMPEIFVEISPSLADIINVQNGDKVEVSSKRGQYEAVACVTPRLKPLNVYGQDTEIVGIVWHWGYMGKSTGPTANDLTPSIGDANTTIPEYKAFVCNVRRVG
ncbi:formate dehydrogenase-N subunit alpha [Candidatus Contubernalis alkaliaceticus]|uniref:formate dehydrogenase-N subunit alpha n=1 Tax=Candidatus Contubernalis alkaliaceticus TaxID=338645 RepID=UPI001F4BFE80|nr:formate dehydrogenase-N subunit alpha [Candidatus Contubernalis alkalaceticus]UNC90832.1 formate dehydrogenase-N subunit alpha [Candidatus Contubernalis alkalaceticus]